MGHGTIWAMKKPAAIFLLTFLLVLVLLPAHTAIAQDAGTVGRMLSAINAARIANGLPPYALNPLLTLSAQRHSEYQASIGQWTHTGPDGSLTLQRALAVGYPATRANENVYAGNVTPEEAVHWWLTADEAHRNNVLHPDMREIGIGAARASDGTIYYTMDISAQPNVLPIFINGDAYSTPDANVMLTLTNETIFAGGPGQIGRAAQVLVSNSADFSGASPQAWSQYIQWTLDASAAGQKTVFVRFVDSAGRTADSQDSIVLDASGVGAPPVIALPTVPPLAPTSAPPVAVAPAPTRFPPTAIPPSPTPTATSSPAAVAVRPAATLSFPDSRYMKARTGQISYPDSSALETGTTVLGAPVSNVRRVLITLAALGVGFISLGCLRLINLARARSQLKEAIPDGDR